MREKNSSQQEQQEIINNNNNNRKNNNNLDLINAELTVQTTGNAFSLAGSVE